MKEARYLEVANKVRGTLVWHRGWRRMGAVSPFGRRGLPASVADVGAYQRGGTSRSRTSQRVGRSAVYLYQAIVRDEIAWEEHQWNQDDSSL